MQTKLTLRMDDERIREAKKLANARGTSVSKLVSDYIQTLHLSATPSSTTLSPVTQSMIGILEKSGVDEEDYKKHLREKHL